MNVISDSTPLIHLSAVSDLHLLRDLFGAIVVPQAVFDEVVTEGKGRPGAHEVAAVAGIWIKVEKVSSTLAIRQSMVQQKLQLGEAQAIHLALESKADLIILDEQRAVEFAQAAGLTVIRTGTVYAAAKRRGIIGAVRHRLDALRAAGFWLHERDYQAILKACSQA